MNRKISAYLSLSGGMILAGSSVVVGKLIVNRFPVFIASWCSAFLSLIVLLPLAWRQNRFIRTISRLDMLIMFFQALTGMVMFRIFMLYGLRFTTANSGGIITSTAPAVIGIIAFFWLKEKLTLYKIGGIFCSVIGILIVNIGQSPQIASEGLNPWLGNILIFGAVLGESLFTILGKMLDKRISPVINTTIVSLFALICFTPFFFYELRSFDFSILGYKDLAAMLYYGLAVTAIAYILWFRGLAVIPAGNAAVFTGFMPLSAVFLSSLILHEKITFAHLISLVLVIIAIILGAVLHPKEEQINSKSASLEKLSLSSLCEFALRKK